MKGEKIKKLVARGAMKSTWRAIRAMKEVDLLVREGESKAETARSINPIR